MSNQPPQNSNPNSGTDGTTGKPTTPQVDPTPPQPSLQKAELLILQLENEKLKSQISQGEVQAGQQEQDQKPSPEQQKVIDDLSSQLTEVYLNQIKGSKLYTDDELKLMDVNQLKSIAEVVRRQNVQLAKQGDNPSSTTLGLPDSLKGDAASSKTSIKEPFNYDPKSGTWKD